MKMAHLANTAYMGLDENVWFK